MVMFVCEIHCVLRKVYYNQVLQNCTQICQKIITKECVFKVENFNSAKLCLIMLEFHLHQLCYFTPQYLVMMDWFNTCLTAKKNKSLLLHFFLVVCSFLLLKPCIISAFLKYSTDIRFCS